MKYEFSNVYKYHIVNVYITIKRHKVIPLYSNGIYYGSHSVQSMNNAAPVFIFIVFISLYQISLSPLFTNACFIVHLVRVNQHYVILI